MYQAIRVVERVGVDDGGALEGEELRGWAEVRTWVSINKFMFTYCIFTLPKSLIEFILK